MKRDIYKDEERYNSWKKEVIELGEEGLNKLHSDLLIQHITDFEQGVNISRSNKKGGRSFIRLNTIRIRVSWMLKQLQNRGINDIRKVKEENLMSLFQDMRTGKLKRKDGKIYKATQDYVKVMKAFWNWYIKTNRKEGKVVLNICEDLDTSGKQPDFVYLEKEKLDKMLPYLTEDEQIMTLFVYDSLIRSPTELLSLQRRNIYKRDGRIYVNIPEEISKTIGRTLSLYLCGDALEEWLEKKEFKQEDYVFNIDHRIFKKKLKDISKKLFKNEIAQGGEYYKNITLYDLRHSGAIHLRILAQRNHKITMDSIRQRGGWTDFKMVNYYTKFLGLESQITKDDLLIEEDKSKMEKEIEELKKQVLEIKDMKMVQFTKIIRKQIIDINNMGEKTRNLR